MGQAWPGARQVSARCCGQLPPRSGRAGTGAAASHMPGQGGWMRPSETEIRTGWAALSTASVPAQQCPVASAQLCQSSPQAAQGGHSPAGQHGASISAPQPRVEGGLGSFPEPWDSRGPGQMCPTPLAGSAGCGADGRRRGSPAALGWGHCFLFLPQPCPADMQHRAGSPWLGVPVCPHAVTMAQGL